ncbi:hypothetical protein IGI46_002225 [Enterococcus sp. AZ163]
MVWQELKVVNLMVKRTEKKFTDYNDYHDRGFMKWVIAYAMDELVKGIEQNRMEALKDIPILPQMSQLEIDEALPEAYNFKKPVSIQLNRKDKFGRQTESVIGEFKGYLRDDELLIGDEWILWEDIRNIQVLYDEKWFKVELFKRDQKKEEIKKYRKEHNPFEISEEKDIYYYLGSDLHFIDDFNQTANWIE